MCEREEKKVLNLDTLRELRARMVRKGIREVDVAKEIGLARSTISGVLTGRGKSRRVIETIERMLSQEPS